MTHEDRDIGRRSFSCPDDETIVGVDILGSCAVRVTLPDGEALIERHILPTGAHVSVLRGRCRPGAFLRCAADDTQRSLVLTIPLGNPMTIRSDAVRDGVDMRPGTMVLDAPVEQWLEFGAGSRGELFQVNLQLPLSMAAELADMTELIAPTLRSLLSPAHHPFHQHSKPAPAIDRFAQVMLRLPYANDTARWFIESQALEASLAILGTLAAEQPRAASPTRTEQARLEEAHAKILAALSAPPGIADLAAAVGLSQARLTSGFEALFGETIPGFVRRSRLEQARAKLLDTSLPIKQIAWEAGYNQVTNFTTAFRRAFGMPPAALRRHPPQSSDEHGRWHANRSADS